MSEPPLDDDELVELDDELDPPHPATRIAIHASSAKTHADLLEPGPRQLIWRAILRCSS
jgi:hypothetical protein